NIIYINERAGIARPEDLVGKRIGVPEYQITAAVWARGLLEDEHGVTAESVEWHQGGLEEWGRKPFEPASPPNVTIVETPEGKTLSGMLWEGEIDALISPRIPTVFKEGQSRIRRLWHDPDSASREYYSRTKLFPIMHTVAVQTRLID